MQGLEILLVFLGMSSIVAVPLAVLIGLPLLAWNVRAFIRLKERELDLKRLQTAAVIRRNYAGLIPAYVDAHDPDALSAWLQTEAEMSAVSH